MTDSTNTPNEPTLRPPRFLLGALQATPAVLAYFDDEGADLFLLVQRHQQGDWGGIDPHDAQANRNALTQGGRLLSVYTVGNRRIYVITEADRSCTTLLFPEEY